MKIGNAPPNTFMPRNIAPLMAGNDMGIPSKPRLVKKTENEKVYFK